MTSRAGAFLNGLGLLSASSIGSLYECMNGVFLAQKNKMKNKIKLEAVHYKIHLVLVISQFLCVIDFSNYGTFYYCISLIYIREL